MKTLQRCKKIDQGDCIGIFSPSEPLLDSRMERFQKGINVLVDNGFKIKYGEHYRDKYYYMAGKVNERLLDIMNLITDKEVNALIASWGGKSCNQLVRYLDYNKIYFERKPIFGFSDACVILNAITSKTGLVTFHGPNVAGKMYETKHSDLNIVRYDYFKEGINLLGNSMSVNSKVIKEGICEGRLYGGNLDTFILGLLGSEYFPNMRRNILFIESAGKTPQLVDQYFHALKNAGVFDHLGGLIIGDFIYEEVDSYKDIDPFEMLRNIFSECNFPIIHCPTFGHPSDLENPIFPLGSLCKLDTKSNSLTLLEKIIE